MKTFKPNKTIKELGIDTTRKFVVVNGNSRFEKGEILKLVEDDETSLPYFENEYGNQAYIYLDRLAYYEEMKEGDWVYVSEEKVRESNIKRIFIRKCNNGVICVNDDWELEYFKGDTFNTEKWGYAFPIPKTKTITLEVTEEQEREINLLLKK